MPWVVADLAHYMRKNVGYFRFYEWRECADCLGLAIAIIGLPEHSRAFTVDDTIFLSNELSYDDLAVYAWHEIGHFATVEGNIDWWADVPQGHVMVRKLEQKAWLFAIMYPVWE